VVQTKIRMKFLVVSFSRICVTFTSSAQLSRENLVSLP
jgi:hypothetical protein